MSNYFNHSSASTVSGTSSSDSIVNAGSYSTIDAGAGDDTIINMSEQAVGLRYDKSFIKYSPFTFSGIYSSIKTGAGNDFISDAVGYSTINPGAGNDTVAIGEYSVFEYAEGDGDDLIEHYTATNTIHIVRGSLRSTLNSGNDVVLVVGSDKITLKDAKGTELNVVDASSAVPAYPVEPYDSLVTGDANNNNIFFEKPNVTVEGGAGNDLIVNDSNVGINARLFGELGNDSIVSNSRGIIIDGGMGDDKIELSGVEQVVRYRDGDGKDTIVGYQSTDTIHIVDGTEYTTQKSGNDVIINVSDGGLVLKNVKGQTINIDTTTLPGEVYIPEWEIAEPTSRMISYDKKKGTVTAKKKFYGEIDAQNFSYVGTNKIDASNATLDVIIRAGKSGAMLWASNADSTLFGGEGNDKIYGGPSADMFVYDVGKGQDLIGNVKEAYSLYHFEDNVVIVGKDIEELSDITLKDSKSAVLVTFDDDKKAKLTINKDSADTPITFFLGSTFENALENGGVLYGDLPEGVSYVTKGNYTQLKADASVDGVSIDMKQINSQIVTVDASNATGNVDIYGNEKNNVLKGSKGGSYLFDGAGNDSMVGTTSESVMDVFVVQMQNSNKKDVIYNYNEGDRIIIDTSLLKDGFPTFDDDTGVISYEGAKAGFNGFVDTKADVVVTLNKRNTLTIKDGYGKEISFYDDDGELLGTFGHILPDGLQYNDRRTDINVSDVSAASKNEVLNINLSNEGSYVNQYYSTVLNVDLTGVAAEIDLVGNAKNNTLKAGVNHTDMHGGAGNDYLYGSTAKGATDNFYYGSGKDIIYNFDPTIDHIYIDEETGISKDTLSKVSAKNFVEKGNDVVLNIDSKNMLTIKDGVGKVIEIVDETGMLDNGAGSVTYNFSLPDGLKYNNLKRTSIDVSNASALAALDSLNLDLTNTTNDDYEFSTTVKKIDLSLVRNGNIETTIIGNTYANEFTAPDVGTTVLYGGHQTGKRATADKLTGGKGNDVFVYALGDGKDQMFNYNRGDTIRLDDSYGEIKSIAFADKRNTVSVTLNNDKNSVFTVTKWDINAPLVFEGSVSTINGGSDWTALLEDGFDYGSADNVSLSDDASKIVISGKANDYVYANAWETHSQVKLIDARSASKVLVEMVGNGLANTIYAGNGGSIIDGGYDRSKMKATHDTIIGGTGNDEFVYDFSKGLGGKDVILNYGYGTDWLVFKTAPKTVTANGTHLQFQFEEKINGKTYTGTLKVNGAKPITPTTPVYIEINGEQSRYYFSNNLKKAAWGSSNGITVQAYDEPEPEPEPEPEDYTTLEGNTAAQWERLGEHKYAYDYGGAKFTVQGNAVTDRTPGNYFTSGSVLSVIVEDGIPDGILVDAANKRIIFSDKFDQSKATFKFAKGDSLSNYELITFSTSASAELPASGVEEYWFLKEETSEQNLDQIIVKEAAVDLPTDFMSDGVKQRVNELAQAVRHRSKK